MSYRLVKYLFRNVAVSKDLLHRLVNSMDIDDDGRISLSEMAAALKSLWRQANGKIPKEKRPKVKTLD